MKSASPIRPRPSNQNHVFTQSGDKTDMPTRSPDVRCWGMSRLRHGTPTCDESRYLVTTAFYLRTLSREGPSHLFLAQLKLYILHSAFIFALFDKQIT